MDGFENNKPADIIIPPGQTETHLGNTKPSKKQKPSVRHTKRKQGSSTKFERLAEAGRWFQMICWLKIPVIGFIYMLGLAISIFLSFIKIHIIYYQGNVLDWLERRN